MTTLFAMKKKQLKLGGGLTVKLAHPYREKLGEDQMDGLESLLSQISLISQREGFEIGVRFAFKVLSELLP